MRPNSRSPKVPLFCLAWLRKYFQQFMTLCHAAFEIILELCHPNKNMILLFSMFWPSNIRIHCQYQPDNNQWFAGHTILRIRTSRNPSSSSHVDQDDMRRKYNQNVHDLQQKRRISPMGQPSKILNSMLEISEQILQLDRIIRWNYTEGKWQSTWPITCMESHCRHLSSLSWLPQENIWLWGWDCDWVEHWWFGNVTIH